MDLYEDKNGLIRCFGRLKNADLSYESKFPILLPRKHRFTLLVIEDMHKKLLHAGVSHTLARVRGEYWIPHGRAEVRRINMSCQVCKRHEGGHYKLPSMPPFPSERVTVVPPFSFIGIDYLGPLFVKGEHVKKVWICLFTCMTIRAVHLEMAEDLTADQFLMCIRRFISRRGKPKRIISDNAPQMKVVDNAFQKLWEQNVVFNEDVNSYFSRENIAWKFIPEYAPWMGGFYERMVKSVKIALKKTIGRKCLSYVQLETLLTEVEAVLNSRPLCYVGDESDKGHMITPNHFLSMNQSSGIIDIDYDIDDPEFVRKLSSKDNLILSWKKGQNILNNFWECWKNEYLQSLRERYQREIKCNGKESKDEPKVNDIVLIKDNLPRGTWKLAKICELIESFDGNVRSAKVKTSKGKMLRRPLNLLYPIEAQDFKEEMEDEDSVSVKTLRPVRRAALVARNKIMHSQ